MEEYKELWAQTHKISSVAEMYDILIDEKAGETYRLIQPTTNEANVLVCVPADACNLLNEEHLKRQGIVMDPSYYGNDFGEFLDDNRDKCIFGDALTSYCVDLDTEEHPIPWLFYICFNNDVYGISNEHLRDLYIRVVNGIAVDTNRKLFSALSPEVVAKYRKEKKPLMFHDIDNNYYADLWNDYINKFEYKINIPEITDFEELKAAIKQELIGRQLI